MCFGKIILLGIGLIVMTAAIFAPLNGHAKTNKNISPSALAQNSSQDDFQIARSDFLKQIWGGVIPDKQTLWLDRDLRKGAKKILRRKFGKTRVHYWTKGNRSVWVLQEIGKYQPISVGIAVENGKIEKLKVLAYRESHGWEVKQEFFTRQFIGAHLNKKSKLDQNVDGISGATLSVRALIKTARLALYFDAQLEQQTP